MAYLIIGMSFGLIVGSLMWMLPSPQEKRLARLRTKAAMADFHVKFIKFERYQQVIPAQVKLQQKSPKQALLRYFWQGHSPLSYSRTLQWVFSEQQELLSFVVDGRDSGTRDSQLPSEFAESIQLALDAAHYFQGLLALECNDVEGKRCLSLYWPEAGDIDSIDFKAPQVLALQTRL